MGYKLYMGVGVPGCCGHDMTVGDVSGETSAPVGRYGADGRGGGQPCA